MAIIRRSIRPSHYTVIDNQVLQDKRLSWKAQGLLTYLLSLPDSWEINIKHLSRERSDGKDSTLSGLKELKTLGYLKKICVRDDRGRVLRWETQVFDLPQSTDNDKPETQKPRNRETQILDNPDSGKPGGIYITYSKKELDQKEIKAANPDFSLSRISNFQDPDQTQNLILDQQGEFSEKQEGLDPEKVNSAAPPIFAPIAPENTPLSRDGGRWDINYLNKVWRDNKAEKWKVSSLMFLNSEIQYGLEQFLQRAGGDRAEAYRLIGISIAEMANTEFYRNKSMMINTLLAADPSKPCTAYCGNFLGAAIDREEHAKGAATIAQTSIAPAIPNHFSGWDT